MARADLIYAAGLGVRGLVRCAADGDGDSVRRSEAERLVGERGNAGGAVGGACAVELARGAEGGGPPAHLGACSVVGSDAVL